jgi:SAM-dependent methyltransferase
LSAVIQTLKRSTRDGVVRLGLAGAAFWLYGKVAQVNPRSVLSNRRYRREGAPDGLPLPPADLIFLVAGSADISWFLDGGARGAAAVSDALHAQHVDVGSLEAILDFGCGCGRVARHWHSLASTRVCGTDYNQRLVDWCRINLPFGGFRTNQLSPPLAYGNAEFDLVYALSVFTHLTQDLQLAWIKELARVVKPGGHLVVSTHGERYAHRLNDEERRRFASGQLVVKNDVKSPGSNTCSAYHPFEYVRDHLAGDLGVVDFRPEGAKGNPHQDLYVLRKP